VGEADLRFRAQAGGVLKADRCWRSSLCCGTRLSSSAAVIRTALESCSRHISDMIDRARGRPSPRTQLPIAESQVRGARAAI
jgi:hypothetical protein